ncbi:MAG TPA: glycosyltransferase [Thermoanaerobaculia bacterium]|nr:glycosyltransferase [Thermoanaerobaculia bacterium]
MTSQSPLFSVVICTYNRAELLGDAIESVLGQDFNPERYEVLVIDNNSTDGTAVLVRHYPRVRYVFEGKQGLSHARNRGWREAAGRYVAYLDDDAVAPEPWLDLAETIAEERQPAIFGGPIRPRFEVPPPKWWRHWYLVGGFPKTPRALVESEIVYGGNFFCRRDLFAQVGGFDERFGRRGGDLGYGEEQVFQAKVRCLLPDEEIYFHPDLYVDHFTPHYKTSWRWTLKNQFSLGLSAARRQGAIDGFSKHARASDLSASIKRVLKIAYTLSLGIPLRDREAFPRPQNYLYENLGRHLRGLGKIYGRFSNPRAIEAASHPSDDKESARSLTP